MMNTLLVFFALPVATIVFSIALQKILETPSLVAAIIFSTFLVTTFAVGNINLLIATIIYTLISIVTAILTKYITENCQNESHLITNCNQMNNQIVNCRRR